MTKVNGSGSIVQLEKDKPKGKCRKWQLRVSTGIDPRTGKYGTRTRRVTGTYTEAQRALRDFASEIEGDKAAARSSFTFEAYCDHYLDVQVLAGNAPNTVANKRNLAKAACAHIGKANLAAVTPGMLNDMYAAMLAGDTLSGKPSKPSYVERIHKFVSLVFKEAVKEGVVDANPADKATSPHAGATDRRAIKPEEVRAFVESLDPTDPCECAYLIAATTGLRRGEVCALSWGDVDLDAGEVYVHRNFDRFRNLKEAKTAAGVRLLPLPQITRDALAAQKAAQAEAFKRLNEGRAEDVRLAQGEDTPVIATPEGERVSPDVLGYWWSRDRASYGLDGWCLHELRHTYITLLAVNKVHPSVMQKIAGHASSKITMDVYTHVNMEAKREAVAAVAAAF